MTNAEADRQIERHRVASLKRRLCEKWRGHPSYADGRCTNCGARDVRGMAPMDEFHARMLDDVVPVMRINFFRESALYMRLRGAAR